jgi:hypothetical protein
LARLGPLVAGLVLTLTAGVARGAEANPRNGSQTQLASKAHGAAEGWAGPLLEMAQRLNVAAGEGTPNGAGAEGAAGVKGAAQDARTASVRVEAVVLVPEAMELRNQITGGESFRAMLRSGLLSGVTGPWRELCGRMGRSSDELMDDLLGGGLLVLGLREAGGEGAGGERAGGERAGGERWWCGVGLVTGETAARLTARLDASPRGVVELEGGAQAVLVVDDGAMTLMVRKVATPAGGGQGRAGGLGAGGGDRAGGERLPVRDHAVVLMPANAPVSALAAAARMLQPGPGAPVPAEAGPAGGPAGVGVAGGPVGGRLDEQRWWKSVASAPVSDGASALVWYGAGEQPLAARVTVQGNRWTVRTSGPHTPGPGELAAVATGGESARTLADDGLIDRLIGPELQAVAVPANGVPVLAIHAAWQDLVWLDEAARELRIGGPFVPVLADQAQGDVAMAHPVGAPVLVIASAPAAGGSLQVEVAVRARAGVGAGVEAGVGVGLGADDARDLIGLDAMGLGILKAIGDRAPAPTPDLLALAGERGRRSVRVELKPGSAGFPWLGDGAGLSWGQIDAGGAGVWRVWQSTPSQALGSAGELGGRTLAALTERAGVRGDAVPGGTAGGARRYTARIRSSPRGVLGQLPPALGLIAGELSSLHRLDLDAWLVEAGAGEVGGGARAVEQQMELRILWGPL